MVSAIILNHAQRSIGHGEPDRSKGNGLSRLAGSVSRVFHKTPKPNDLSGAQRVRPSKVDKPKKRNTLHRIAYFTCRVFHKTPKTPKIKMLDSFHVPAGYFSRIAEEEPYYEVPSMGKSKPSCSLDENNYVDQGDVYYQLPDVAKAIPCPEEGEYGETHTYYGQSPVTVIPTNYSADGLYYDDTDVDGASIHEYEYDELAAQVGADEGIYEAASLEDLVEGQLFVPISGDRGNNSPDSGIDPTSPMADLD